MEEPEPADDDRERWVHGYEASPLRDADFTNLSGEPVEPAYGSAPTDAGWPGQYPYTRGPYPSMYRTKLWTMRLFSGFGTAEDTNARFKELLAAGGGGLSVAFDLPTLMGRDSDDPRCEGEVGRCGVAVDSICDVEDLFAGVDLGSITTSMTINSPAIVLLAMYVVAAERSGISRSRLGGTLQNDILKEYQAQKEYVFPPKPSLRVVSDIVDFAVVEMPRFHPISVSGYHIREAGSTAAEELAFTLANGFSYVEAALARGRGVDEVAPSLSFFFNSHIDFFEEIAKYRAARRVWARWMRERYGSTEARSQQLRFHTQTAGVSLTAQQPELNVVRTAIEAMAGVLGGTQSLHTNSMDEVLGLPTERTARIALRTQQVIVYETGIANVADPLGGSYYVERLTSDLEAAAEKIFSEIEEMGGGSILGGVIAGIEAGWFQNKIAESAWQFEQKVAKGQRIVVGVNAMCEGNEESGPPIWQISPGVEKRQRERLSEVRRARSGEAVRACLARLAAGCADPGVNLVPLVIDSVDSMCTVGEIMATMAEVFGTWSEPSGV